MKTIKKLQLRIVMVLAVLMIGFAALADEPDPDLLDDDPGVPIDGGVSLLIAAGVGYGAKKVHDARKKKGKHE